MAIDLTSLNFNNNSNIYKRYVIEKNVHRSEESGCHTNYCLIPKFEQI